MSKARFLLGFYDDDGVVLKAAKAIREAGADIHDIYTPFPVHGMDEALDIKYTRIPVAGFIIGTTFALTAFFSMWYIFAVDFPLNYGGKPMGAFASFIPPTFEATVLTAAIGMAICYMTANHLVPSPKQHPIDLRITSDRFVMAFIINEGDNVEKLQALMMEHGALEVKEKDVELNPSLKKA